MKIGKKATLFILRYNIIPFAEFLSGDFEKAYLFGFLGHDGYITTLKQQIGIKINPKDHKILYKLAEAIDLDLSKVRIKYGKDIKLYKGQRREYYYARLKFGCKPMYTDIVEQGDIGSGSDDKAVPPAIKKL